MHREQYFRVSNLDKLYHFDVDALKLSKLRLDIFWPTTQVFLYKLRIYTFFIVVSI